MQGPTDYRRRLGLMLGLLLGMLAAVAGFNFIVNPLGVWSHRTIGPLYYRIDLNRVMTPGFLRTAGAATVLIGNSRTHFGIPIEQGYRFGVENAAIPGATLTENLKEIEVALGADRNLKRIVWGIDFYTFDQGLLETADADTMARLNGSVEDLILESLLSGDALRMSGALIGRRFHGRAALAPSWLAPVPWPPELICQVLAHPETYRTYATGTPLLTQLVHTPGDYAHLRLSPQAMARTLALAARLRRAGVELLLFVPPLSQYELELIRQAGAWPVFEQWKRMLAEHFSYWDFSGYNDLARQDPLFMDVTHVNPAVGEFVLRKVLGQSPAHCGTGAARLVWDAGLWVDSANVAQVLRLQDLRMAQATQAPNRYARLAAAALALRYPGAHSGLASR